jgi:hypothetical protein
MFAFWQSFDNKYSMYMKQMEISPAPAEEYEFIQYDFPRPHRCVATVR